MKKSPIKNMEYWKSKSGIAPLKERVANTPNILQNAKEAELMPMSGGTGGINDMIAEKVDEKVEEKVSKVVNQNTNEGLV
jgi:hypothetical protein|tara:strand:+ start:679 stop:918 length:240 start_codon:yes stop_codon:yes gene_type:complete